MKRLLLFIIPVMLASPALAELYSGFNGIERIVDTSPEWDAKIYPNPNNGVFNVMISGSSASLNVMVFNVIGEKVFELKILGDHGAKIDLSTLEKGLYVIQILDEKKGEIVTRRMQID